MGHILARKHTQIRHGLISNLSSALGSKLKGQAKYPQIVTNRAKHVSRLDMLYLILGDLSSTDVATAWNAICAQLSRSFRKARFRELRTESDPSSIF